MMWLDWHLFGNGFGMASPYFDDAFYWLKDMSRHDRATAHGRFYRVSGGLGAQLHSCEWVSPSPGTHRVLAGMEFRVFQASRRGPRVDVSWERVPRVKNAEDARSVVEAVKNWGHGE